MMPIQNAIKYINKFALGRLFSAVVVCMLFYMFALHGRSDIFNDHHITEGSKNMFAALYAFSMVIGAFIGLLFLDLIMVFILKGDSDE